MLLGMAPYSFYGVKFTMEHGYENADVIPVLLIPPLQFSLFLKLSCDASSACIFFAVRGVNAMLLEDKFYPF